jgi:glycosyltransferase involved in cell wall biosynthesis
LILNYEFPPIGGGGGTCSRYFARELARLGHEVEVVTSHWGKLPRVVKKGRFTLRRLRGLRRLPGQSNPVEMMAYVATAFPYLLLRGAPKPDVMISFHSIPSGMPAFPLSMLWGVPHIVLFRGGDVPGWLPGELQLYHRATLWLNRLIVYQSAEALANSDGLRNLAQKSFPKKQVGVICNGIDLGSFCPPADNRSGRTGPVRLVFAGRITTQKGIETILDALAHEAMRGLDWHLDVAGDGPMLEEYRSRAEELGLSQRITWHGWLDRPEVRTLYGSADVLVFPSRYEGMPNVVLEALGCGLPVVGTRIAGTEELVQEGRNGFLVEVDDPGALADRVATLVRDGELRRRMGAEARRFVEERWSWTSRAKELEDIVERILAQRGR